MLSTTVFVDVRRFMAPVFLVVEHKRNHTFLKMRCLEILIFMFQFLKYRYILNKTAFFSIGD